MKKVLGIFLVLAMLLSFAPALEVAAAETPIWVKVNSLADISTTDTFAITITVGENTYVLPVYKSGSISTSDNIPERTGTVKGNTLTITDTEYTYGWKLTPVAGDDPGSIAGYNIYSADGKDYYLYMRKSTSGINIWGTAPTEETKKTTYLWNILDCGLLGAYDGVEKYHTLSVKMDTPGWWTPGIPDGTAEGPAHSDAQDNVLGLWMLHTACTDAEGDGDHKCDGCGKLIADYECTDKADDGDHKCDECGELVASSTCSDADNDGDHKCDECTADNASECADTDGDNVCDECQESMCTNHQDAAGDGDHKCDGCGKLMEDYECTDKADDGDHKCDECGELVASSTCSDADDDGDHKCDECGKENMNPCVDSDTDDDHNCDECGKDGITDHDWAEATTAKPKTCKVCGKTEGDPLPTYHWVKVNSLSDISENDTFAITITVGGKTYVLPVVPSGKADESKAIPEIPGTVKGNRLIFTDTSYSYGWNLVPTTGGYHIKSGDKYLYVSASNNGILIYKKNPTTDAFVWNVLDCGLLGATDGTNYRTLCVDGTLDSPQWGTYKIADDGRANSKVRDNTLGLWKRVVGSPDDYASNTGDPITLTAAVMLVSGMSVVALIPKKKD